MHLTHKSVRSARKRTRAHGRSVPAWCVGSGSGWAGEARGGAAHQGPPPRPPPSQPPQWRLDQPPPLLQGARGGLAGQGWASPPGRSLQAPARSLQPTANGYRSLSLCRSAAATVAPPRALTQQRPRRQVQRTRVHDQGPQLPWAASLPVGATPPAQGSVCHWYGWKHTAMTMPPRVLEQALRLPPFPRPPRPCAHSASPEPVLQAAYCTWHDARAASAGCSMVTHPPTLRRRLPVLAQGGGVQ